MKLLVDIGHPAHVHFFRNAIKTWLKKGFEVSITAKDKDIALKLMELYGMDYRLLGNSKKGILNKGINLLNLDFNLYKIVRRFKPDVLMGIHDPYIAQVGKLSRKKSIVFTDTEMARFNFLTFPFADVICTPSCFKKDLGAKHVRYDGYHELAYLHPDYFEPDRSVLEGLDIDRGEKIIILRLISWSAHHDISLKGLGVEKEDFIKKLEDYGRVFITSEVPVNGKLAGYALKIPVHKMHSLMYYADLYVGEGGTMAAEAAVLGTPSVHIESVNGLPTGDTSGNFRELKDKYGLLFYYADRNKAFGKSLDLLENHSRAEWRRRREKLLRDKIDVTSWMVDFVEKTAI